ncbi:sterol desaturase family protein [Parvularcula lutaonensis]|uniref:Sterol desaturase family protein n=1 Tax=Parvularcula lutaonensis TaxID=491923 RepID=A0ABV7MBG6_9PROT|nr:sterol desaturase family protein [Parvularcula lutaonensis]GGY40273.1 hypothetical protein GCM10007148_05940 [Parvularcula lutaonensis]
MSVHHYLLFFAPVFLTMIAVEVFVGRKRGLALYSRGETTASIAIALGQRLLALFPLSLVGFITLSAYENRLFEIPSDAWWYIPLLFVLMEFAYYWFHRLSHGVRWLWATHSVHHSIEEMNILASYRFGWTGRISMGGLIYAPLALLGFPPAHYLAMLAVNLMYQSWLHTDLIGKLGPLEGIVNTPSAHRVHHAKNADYLDRNHGGVLMVFDRLFGTYQAERDHVPVEYGLVTPSGSKNPLRIAFHEWGSMLKDLRRHRPAAWPGLLFGPPGWAPDGQARTSADIRREYRNSLGAPDANLAIAPSVQPAE